MCSTDLGHDKNIKLINEMYLDEISQITFETRQGFIDVIYSGIVNNYL